MADCAPIQTWVRARSTAAACLDTDRGEGGACARSGRGRAPEDDSGPLQLAPFAAHLSGLDRADACSGFIHEADIARRLSYFAF